MKARTVVLNAGLFISLLFIYGFGGGSKYPGGSPGGYTGSPGDSKNCTYCHGGTATNALGWITSDIPLQGYIPGETYTITVTVSGTGDKGFEVSPQDEEGNLLGTLVDAAGVHLVSGNKAVTQDNSSSANPKVWTFQWVAPDPGTGQVKFYGAFTVNKPVTKLSVLAVQEDQSVGITETMAYEVKVFPNPARESLSISLISAQAGHTHISIISATGMVMQVQAHLRQGENLIRIELPDDMPSGIYFVRLQAGENLETRRFVKL